MATDKVVHGCAASCRASGYPSSSAHRAETVRTLSHVNRKAGSAASRQSQNTWTAGARRSATWIPHAIGREQKRAYPEDMLTVQIQTHEAGREHREVGIAVEGS